MDNPQRTTLPNGLVTVTENMPEMRSVSLGLWIRVGSRHETSQMNGISHFIEHMVFKGTERRSAEAIARSVDSIGGHLDAFTAKEFICFSTKVLDEHFPVAFDVLADLVQNPTFQEEDISRERKVVQEEIKMIEDTPDDLVYEIFTQKYWRNHSLGRPILGTQQTVKRFTQPALFDYFGSHYAPNRLLVAAAGHLEHARVVDLVTSYFSDRKPSKLVLNGKRPVPFPKITQRNKKDLEQVHICLGAPAYAATDKRRYACYILNTILGGGMSSRLFQNVRERHGLAYAIFSALNGYSDTGYLSIYAGTAPQNVRQVIRLVVQEFAELKKNPITAEEMKRVKEHLKGSLMLSLESTSSRMSNLARQEMFFGRFSTLDEVIRRIDRVTADEVQEVSREFFQPEKLALTVLGPMNGTRLKRSILSC